MSTYLKSPAEQTAAGSGLPGTIQQEVEPVTHHWAAEEVTGLIAIGLIYTAISAIIIKRLGEGGKMLMTMGAIAAALLAWPAYKGLSLVHIPDIPWVYVLGLIGIVLWALILIPGTRRRFFSSRTGGLRFPDAVAAPLAALVLTEAGPRRVKAIAVARRLTILPHVDPHGESSDFLICECEVSLYRFSPDASPPPELRLTGAGGTPTLAPLMVDSEGSRRPGTALYRAQVPWHLLRRTMCLTVQPGEGYHLHDLEVRLPEGIALKIHEQSDVRMGFEICHENFDIDSDGAVRGNASDGHRFSVPVKSPSQKSEEGNEGERMPDRGGPSWPNGPASSPSPMPRPKKPGQAPMSFSPTPPDKNAGTVKVLRDIGALPPERSIVATVTGGGKPIVGATVQVSQTADGAQPQIAATDSAGQAAILLPDDQAQVAYVFAQAAGYEDPQVASVDVKDGDNLVALDLRPRKKR